MQGRNLALVVQLLDMRHAPSSDDIAMIETFIEQEIPFILVLTKCDKLSQKQRNDRMEAFAKEVPCGDQVTMLPFSAVTGEGVEELRNILEDVTEQDAEE